MTEDWPPWKVELGKQIFGKVKLFYGETKMKIEVGKWYKIKYGNGYKAYIGYRIPDEAFMSGGFNYIGYVASKDGVISYQESWNEFGKSSSADEHRIIEEWKEPKSGEVWVNIYKGNLTGNIFPSDVAMTKERAMNGEYCDLSNIIARIKVTWTEGQFDE